MSACLKKKKKKKCPFTNTMVQFKKKKGRKRCFLFSVPLLYTGSQKLRAIQLKGRLCMDWVSGSVSVKHCPPQIWIECRIFYLSSLFILLLWFKYCNYMINSVLVFSVRYWLKCFWKYRILTKFCGSIWARSWSKILARKYW